MYLNHYHLKAKPFDLSPNPKFLWFDEKHSEALATLQYGIKEDVGFLVLTGDVGVGKTVLIHQLIDNLDSSTIVAHVTEPDLGILDFFKVLAVEFDIATEFNSKGEFLIELEKFLHRAYADHKKVLLIIDEAQRINNTLLDQIRVLSNIELSDRKLINIFFVGQSEFKTMLMANSNRAIRQRIAINYHLDPLTESETRLYIEHRLKVAGASRKIFKSNAFLEIFRSTGGYPRVINIICDHALLTGYIFGLKSIDAGVIKECEQELNIRANVDINKTGFQMPTDTTWSDTFSPPPRRSPFMGYPLLIGICIVIGAFASYYFLWPTTRGTMKSMTQQKPAESFNHQADTAVNNQLKLSELIEKEQTQASSKNETNLAQPSVDTAVNNQLKLSEMIEKKQTQASSKNETNLAQPSVEKGAQIKAVPKDEIAVAGRQSVENGAQVKAAPKDEIVVAGRQPEISTDQTTPASNKAQINLALLIASSDAKPKPQLNRGARVSTATGKSETTPLKSESAKGSNASASTSMDKTTQKVAIKKQDAQYSKAETTVASRQPEISTDQAVPAHDQIPEKLEVENDVAMPAKAERNVVLMAALPDAEPKPQLKPSKEQFEVTAPSVKQQGSNGLENRLRSFLQNYCTTYAAKDLDAFTIFFAPNASENGKPFESLLPKYQRNFRFIETIQYRIELQQFSYDDNKEIVEIDGSFFLKWLLPKKKWRGNSGTISMSLKENGASFLVQRLDYQSTHSK
jgi:type II secretory pathway predicted ATPase ExeA